MSKPVVTHSFTRRAVIFGAANVAAVSVLLGRLYYLQFQRGDIYKNLSEGNRVKLQLIAPVRGILLDRYGEVLADNQKNFRLYLDTEINRKPEKVLQSLAEILDLSPERIREIIKRAGTSRYSPPVMIKEHLSWDELAQFEFYRLNYPEIYVEAGQVRFYPLGDKASHLLGYVGALSKKDVKEDEEITEQAEEEMALGRLPDFKVGKNGVEKAMEPELRGVAGSRETEVNVHGLALRELKRDEGRAGKTIKLTIDKRLQLYASSRLGSESAAIVVMNVRNGDILALCSMPSFEPNAFSKGIKSKYWKELLENKRVPLMNKALAGQYPPGSTFKMVVGLAALKAGLVSPENHIFCGGNFMLGNHSFRCWKQPGGHGSVNLRDALAQSCDVYFFTLAQRLGIDRIAEMSRMFGLGELTGTGLPDEKPAIVPDNAWKRRRYNQQWQGGDTINVGIGQGYILTTPMQLTVMAARLATGLKVVPRLTTEGPEPEFDPLPVSTAHLASVQEGMNAVTNSERGTAFGRRIKDPRFLMAGKTGTSQVKPLITHGVDQNKLPWEDRHHALFVGYAPVSAPKYAAAVIVEHGGGGASAAAPIVSDVLLKIQSLDAGEDGPKMPENLEPEDREKID